MSDKPSDISDKITVLVFKDNFAARTFQIPLAWISRFGVLATIVFSFAFMSVVFAVKYYLLASKVDLSHIQDLEQEIADLKSAPKPIEAKTNEAVSLKVETSPSPTQSSFLFTMFPSSVTSLPPNQKALPFTIQKPKTVWQEDTLKVRFALEYLKNDQGSQQGRILILARGPEIVMAYPPGILNRAGAPNLISPEEGESFSVSRFREVKADFGPVTSKDAIQDVEIFIMNKDNQILIYQKLSLKDSDSD